VTALCRNFLVKMPMGPVIGYAGWPTFTAEAVFGECGEDEQRFFTGFVRDISERKRTEEAYGRASASRMINRDQFRPGVGTPRTAVEYVNLRVLGLQWQTWAIWRSRAGLTSFTRRCGTHAECWYRAGATGQAVRVRIPAASSDGLYRWFKWSSAATRPRGAHRPRGPFAHSNMGRKNAESLRGLSRGFASDTDRHRRRVGSLHRGIKDAYTLTCARVSTARRLHGFVLARAHMNAICRPRGRSLRRQMRELVSISLAPMEAATRLRWRSVSIAKAGSVRRKASSAFFDPHIESKPTSGRCAPRDRVAADPTTWNTDTASERSSRIRTGTVGRCEQPNRPPACAHVGE